MSSEKSMQQINQIFYIDNLNLFKLKAIFLEAYIYI